MPDFSAITRAAALLRLAEILPRAGRTYAATRNTDAGPDAPPTTTALSPYLRRRLILEQEVVAAALDTHGPDAARKFVEEVFWRTYFKGHLETHPAIWTRYRADAATQHARRAANPGLRRAYDQAIAGQTGIDGFDHWARELLQTGWLHNHARMWFASIWIFTLRLPWALGADHFLRHLIDGDPASNTLSWRWVAGLHTRGKPYAARAENIRRYTDGRFDPTGLDEDPAPLEEVDPPPAIKLPTAAPPATGDVALLLHLDDLHPESLPLAGAKVTRLAGVLAHAPDATARVRRADKQALADALARAAAHFQCPPTPPDTGWNAGLPIVTPYAPVGPSAEALPPCLRIRRPWDEQTWPRATGGYFKVKSAIPTILRTLTPLHAPA